MTAIDLGATIAPKSDQLNADDLITCPLTIEVTRVEARPRGGQGDQPIAIYFKGDNGKPYLPCKSMRRVLVQCWGREGANYPGRSMTLFRDESVVFGGAAVGGIRISHMSHLDRDVTMSLTASKQTRKPYTVRMLAAAPKAERKTVDPELKRARAQEALDEIITAVKGAQDVDVMVASAKERIARIVALIPDASTQVESAANEARKQ